MLCNLIFSLGILFLSSSCSRLFKDEKAPPPPRRIKTGLISPSDGEPVNEGPKEHWTKSLGEGIYKVGKPYKVNGIWYFPKEDFDYDEVGYASWYGPDFHNKRTANGEIFDMNMLSAAHKTLPLPCVVRVTNLQNGRSLVLRVNDRGPFVNDRLLDVSRKAAQLLGFKDQGTTKVRVELLPEESMTVASLMQNSSELSKDKLTPAESGSVLVTQELNSLSSFGDPSEIPVGKDLPGATLEGAGQADLFDEKPWNSISRHEQESSVPVISEDEYNRQLEASLSEDSMRLPEDPILKETPRPAVQNTASPKPAVMLSKRLYIQAGAYSRIQNAEGVSRKLQGAGNAAIKPIQTSRGTLYKVQVGPFNSRSEARHALSHVIEKGHPDAHIISQ